MKIALEKLHLYMFYADICIKLKVSSNKCNIS